MKAFRRLIEAIEAEGSAALVTLARVEGSSPREAGVRMVVRPSGGFHGTIGGGTLEFAALEAANEALRKGRGPAQRRSLALGPELGQCCGGRVEWRVETFDKRDLEDISALAIAEGGASAALSARLGPDGRIQRTLGTSVSERRLARQQTRRGPNRSACSRARSICSVPVTSDGHWRSRLRRYPSQYAGSIRGATPSPHTRPRTSRSFMRRNLWPNSPARPTMRSSS